MRVISSIFFFLKETKNRDDGCDARKKYVWKKKIGE